MFNRERATEKSASEMRKGERLEERWIEDMEKETNEERQARIYTKGTQMFNREPGH